MRRIRKCLSAALAMSLVLGMGACGGSGGRTPQDNNNAGGGDAGTTATTAAPATTLKEEAETEANFADQAGSLSEINPADEAGTGPAYTPGQKAGELKVLCYYDLNTNTPQLSEIFSERFGGTLSCEIVGSLQMQEKLNTLLAAGDSPDLVRYDGWVFPMGVSKNLFTPLDDWLDKDAEIWSGVKTAIDSFSWKGKHYYYPQKLEPNYCMVFELNRMQEIGLANPMDLYDAGEWNWDAFEDMCRAWCSQGDEYIGIRGASWTGYNIVVTTGVQAFTFTDNDIINNIKDINVQRAMEWCEKLYREGYVYDGGEWQNPDQLFVDGKLLFMPMGYEWGFESAQQGAFNNKLDQEFGFVPFPKDPQSDKYYHTGLTVGYLCPAGAKNVQGTVQYILTSRIYETDPQIVASERAKKVDPAPAYYPKCPDCKYNYVDEGNDDLNVCPNCGAARKQKFKAVYSERQFGIYDDLRNPEKFQLIYDSITGFGDDMTYFLANDGGTQESLFDGPLFYGMSFTQQREEYYNPIEAILDVYRSALKS